MLFGPGGPPHHGGRRGGSFMQPPVWGFLQPCLLLVLAEGEHHGYSLIDELNKRRLLGSEIDIGNLYRTLRKMEHEGLVESRWAPPEAGPQKRIYHITEGGRVYLQRWADMLEQRTSSLIRFLEEYHRTFGKARKDAQTDPAIPPDEWL